METKELKKQLKKIASMSGKDLTAEQLQLVKDAAAQYGVEIAKTDCKDCHIDAAVQVYNKICAEQGGDDRSDRQYVLKKGVDVLFNGLRINDATLTDELAAQIIEQGFATYWFAKC